MTREQMIDEAVRQLFIRPGMKRPKQFLTAITNRVRAYQAFHAGVPERCGWHHVRDKWYSAQGQGAQAYSVGDLKASSLTGFALQDHGPTVARIRAEFRRIADEQAHG
jgi:hypothetical protein